MVVRGHAIFSWLLVCFCLLISLKGINCILLSIISAQNAWLLLILTGGDCLATNGGNVSVLIACPWMYSSCSIFVFIMWNRSLPAPVILSGLGKHRENTKYTLMNKVSVSVFHFSVKNRKNLITSLHSSVCLDCHRLFSVTRFATISLPPCRHLLSAGLYCLSLKSTSQGPAPFGFGFFFLSLLPCFPLLPL